MLDSIHFHFPRLVLTVLGALIALSAAPASAQGLVPVFVESADFYADEGLHEAYQAVEAGWADTIVLRTSVHDVRPLHFTHPLLLVGNGSTLQMAPWEEGTMLEFEVEGDVIIRDVLLSGSCTEQESCANGQQGILISEQDTLRLEETRVTNFSTTRSGAGLACLGWCYVVDCDFDHNTSVRSDEPVSPVPYGGRAHSGVGGAIFAFTHDVHPGETEPQPELYLERTRFFENQAASGGAVFVRGHSTVIENCAFDHNRATGTATGKGGALFARTYGDQSTVDCRIGNSTFHNNQASLAGGDAYLEGHIVVVESSTFVGGYAKEGRSIRSNYVGDLYLANSIIDGGSDDCSLYPASVTTCGLLTHSGSACVTQNPTTPSLACPNHFAGGFGLDPYAPLALQTPRGGPVGPMMGRAPRLGSMAVNNAASNMSAPWLSYTTDAAGNARWGWTGPGGDIGAVEL